MDDLAIVERQLGRRAARVPARRRALPVRRARPSSSSGRSTTTGDAVPDAVLAHLPAPRGADRRGSRPAAASRAGREAAEDDPELAREPRARARRAARAPAGAAGRDRRRDAAPAASSACTPTPPSRSPGPGYELGDAHPRRGRAALAAGRLLHGSMIGHLMDVELARQQWEDGRRRVERAPPGSPDVAAARRRGRARRGRAPPPDRADVHARGARRRATTTPTTGRATCSTTPRPEDAPPPTRRPSPTRPSSSTPAARSTTGRDARARRHPRGRGRRSIFAAGVGLGQALDDNARAAPARRRSCARSTRCRSRRRRGRPSP